MDYFTPNGFAYVVINFALRMLGGAKRSMDTPQGSLQGGTRRASSSVPQRAFTTGSTREGWALLTDMDSAALLAAGIRS